MINVVSVVHSDETKVVFSGLRPSGPGQLVSGSSWAVLMNVNILSVISYRNNSARTNSVLKCSQRRDQTRC